MPASITLGSRTLDFSRTHVMGILNVTPDSFFDGGRYTGGSSAEAQALLLEEAGADVIDVGGESTRPGSKPVDESEERARVLPVIRAIRKRSSVPISIDTTKSAVARAALDAGANAVNDISGLRFDPAIADLAAERAVPLVLMHSRAIPETMQKNVRYGDLLAEILRELEASIDLAVSRGVARETIIVDPGIGFGKSPEHNLQILASPGFLAPLGLPVLVGPSNKSFIGAVTDSPVEERTGGTAAAVSAAVLAGVHMIRVHDVATMRQVASIAEAIRKTGG
ncbi:MAG: dihydropteroate synthase [Deltaproteobacteria bacterium]|nr:dihydropteroate synthase [Deltaproteobacteria bacterium]